MDFNKINQTKNKTEFFKIQQTNLLKKMIYYLSKKHTNGREKSTTPAPARQLQSQLYQRFIYLSASYYLDYK